MGNVSRSGYMMPVWLGLLSAERLGSKWENLEIKQMEDSWPVITWSAFRNHEAVMLLCSDGL